MITRVKGSVFNTFENMGFVSVKDMGPENTDISVPLAAALAAGYPIYVPVGTWLVGSISVPANGIIMGNGVKSVLKAKDLLNATVLSIGINCLLQDFLVDGNKNNQVGSGFHTIDLTNSTDTELIGVTSKDAKGNGFYIAGTANEVELFQCAATGFIDSGFKVAAGTNISLIAPKAYSSDAVATGDGIAIASAGLAVSQVTISDPVCKSNAGRGISLLGNGSKNVTDVSITNPRCVNNVSHGLHAINADRCSVTGGLLSTNGGDGLRIEGDVQNSRFTAVNSRANVSFGIREVTAGSTPNLNGYIYSICTGNGNNTITKLGAGSYIV